MDLGIPGLGPAIRIGIGGSAIVYRARQEKLNRNVAIKLLTNQDPAFVRRFEREAKMLGRLSRLPGIVTIHDSGFTTNDEPYLILEYCPSSLLDRVYRDGPYQPDQAAAIMGRVAATVAEAHSEGIIHRDLKPANILLAEADEPLISDFGISSVLGATGNMSTSVGFTPGYVAPETLTGKQGDAAVDVYALGATLFHLITGHAPFMGDETSGSNLLALANRIDSEPVPDLRPDGVADHVCAAIEWAMAKGPNDRPTAAQLADRLDAKNTVDNTARSTPGSKVASKTGEKPNSGPVPDVGPGRPVEAVQPGAIVSARPSSDAPRPTRIDPTPATQDSVDQGGSQSKARSKRSFEPTPPAWPGAAIRTPGGKSSSLGSSRVAAGVVVAAFGLMSVGLLVAARTSSGGDAEYYATTTALTNTVQFTTTSGPPGFTATTGPPLLGTAGFASASESGPETMAGYQDRWAAERADIIFSLTDQYGLDADGRLRGPAGFEIDTANCPADWSDTPGSLAATEDTASTLKLGFVVPDDSPDHQSLLIGINKYFDWVNEEGGIGPDGTQIKTVSLPETANPGDQAEQSLQEVEANGLLSVATLSTATGLAIYNELNESCIPHPFTAGAHPAWADPVAHPWTTGLERSYRSEAAAWAKLIDSRLSEPASVAILSVDDDLRALYEDGFRAAANNGTKIASIETVSVGPERASVVEGLEQLAGGEPKAIIVIASGLSCPLAVELSTDMGFADIADLRIVNSDCEIPLYQVSSEFAADGWLQANDGVRSSSPFGGSGPSYQPVFYNPFVVFAHDRLSVDGFDPGDEQSGLGFGLYGWAYHQALEIAARLPGGLTRTNFILAQRSMSHMTAPIVVDAVDFGVAGNEDAHYLEDAVILRFWASDGYWVAEQNVELDGSTPRCSWTPNDGCG